MTPNRLINAAGDFLAVAGFLCCCLAAWWLHPVAGLFLFGAGLLGLGVRAALR
jgi:hypothetical protein